MYRIHHSRSHPTSHLATHYDTMESTAFLQRFGEEYAEVIRPGDDIYSSDLSVTSLNIGKGISIFALEKENDKTTAVLCWHVSEDTPDHAIVKKVGAEEIDQDESCVRCFEFDKTYAFYIIGGKHETTQRDDSLLSHIQQMIKEEFPGSSIALKVINPCSSSKGLVSANLQRNGRLTLCFHDREH